MISDEAIELLRHENARAYLAVAAATCALYDHVTTLDEEIELVWRRKWSVVQMLFLFNRYAGDVLLM
ncbi:hypothetical protein D9613_002490 [Agrocybe pediades]|uniref:DUF6533 domain-containing protein n=1 Tax=Agrocybe pediades TaxID=84607 RepID=A0A8H4VLZ0_9AGAR|nr:hypothetical protein D9613_002490 [Agrocybe pediades]